jgi:hypothetical protein
MRYEDMPAAELRPGDGKAMERAIEQLRTAGIAARRPAGNPHQIKVTHELSFYPTSGKIVPDGKQSWAKRGVQALIEHLGTSGISLE